MALGFQLIYFMTAFLNIALVSLIFLQRPKDPMVKTFSVFTLTIVGWIVTNYYYSSITDPAAVLFVGRVNYIFAELLAFFAFFFAYMFPKKTFTFTKKTLVGFAVWVIALCLLTFDTDLVIENEVIQGVSRFTEYGSLFFLFVLHFVGFVVGSVAILIMKYRKLKAALRQQILIFTIGLAFALTVGMITNLIAPFLLKGDNDIANYGPLATIIFLLTTGYTVAKHAMLKIKVVATQLFVMLLLLLFVVQAALSTSGLLQVLASISLGLATLIGIALVDSVRREVEEREQLEELTKQLQAANKHLLRVDEMKSEFISIASHELRTPVSVVKGYLSLLIDGAYGKIEEGIKERLTEIYDINERLVHLINNLLNSTRIEKGRVEFIIREVDIAEIIKKSVKEIRYRATERDMTVTYVPPEHPMPQVKADADKVLEVLVNLIENAISYSPEGTEITIRTRIVKEGKSGKFVKVSITDQGYGLTKAQQKKIFGRFYRHVHPETRHRKGTGLGLYISKTFIDGMGGTIGVEWSEPRKGSTFVFMLPVADSDVSKGGE